MRKLDKHYSCSKSLKTMFALGRNDAWFKKTMMEVENHAKFAEYAVEPRSAKSTPPDERKNRSPRVNQKASNGIAEEV